MNIFSHFGSLVFSLALWCLWIWWADVITQVFVCNVPLLYNQILIIKLLYHFPMHTFSCLEGSIPIQQEDSQWESYVRSNLILHSSLLFLITIILWIKHQQKSVLHQQIGNFWVLYAYSNIVFFHDQEIDAKHWSSFLHVPVSDRPGQDCSTHGRYPYPVCGNGSLPVSFHEHFISSNRN